MLDKFYENLLGLTDGWFVEDVNQDNSSQEVTVRIAYNNLIQKCPKCGKEAFLNDIRERTIQHKDTCDYKTFLLVKYPRVKCQRCGTQAIAPPFAAANSRFTKSFERRIIELCYSSSIQKVARDLGLNWHVIEGIKRRAVRRGIERQRQRPGKKVKNIAIDEVSFRKYHDYLTIITDKDRGHVIGVLHDRTAEALTNFLTTQQVADFTELKSISMDMWSPYIKAIRDYFPNADQLICFDRFHVAQLINRALDMVRRRESAAFNTKANPLKGTRFEWLRNSGKIDNRTRRKFFEITRMPLLTAKAWRLKELACTLWNYQKEGSALKAWLNLIKQLKQSKIDELKKLSKTIGYHLHGILNSIRLRANNGLAEARNSCIQRIKQMACGFRNKDRFATEIIYQYGGLNMTF